MGNEQQVTFSGGRLDGLVVACPEHLAAKLPDMDLSVTPGGKLYDRRRRRYVAGAEVVRRPTR